MEYFIPIEHWHRRQNELQARTSVRGFEQSDYSEINVSLDLFSYLITVQSMIELITNSIVNPAFKCTWNLWIRKNKIGLQPNI